MTQGKDRGSLKRLKTGIKGFDTMLNGGLPENRAVLILGGAGTGKTVFLNEFLYRGIKEFDQPGLFITFEEKPRDIIENVKNFGWDFDNLIKKKKLLILDFTPDINKIDMEVSQDYHLMPLIEQIKNGIKEINAKRVVIDNLGNLFLKYSNEKRIREGIYLLSQELKKIGVTTLISGERKSRHHYSLDKIEEFVSDGAISLSMESGQQNILRKLFIIKMRGIPYRTAQVQFEISEEGLTVFPKIPAFSDITKTSFKVRKKFGVKKLDKILGGGIPQGHVILIAGNTGTGKTTLGMHFVEEGIKAGDKIVWVSLEEPVDQLKKSARNHGWVFEKYERSNKLKFVSVPLIDVLPDKLLYMIFNEVKEIGATRVIIDSISSLESATMNKEKVREFWIQLTAFFKNQGITGIVNYLSPDIFGSSEGKLLSQLSTSRMRLSSVTDGIILLRYVEKDNSVHRLINVLKLRGSVHDKDIYQYEIKKKGFVMGEKFKK